ncbi:hypothetical protein R5R35_013239 [Gryllus longicercus]|uniref:Uncharacterized protein n=1 Tax=Gryllus longicercus TaxID=2509291 RepID=A0AAN9WCC8_9ORTH
MTLGRAARRRGFPSHVPSQYKDGRTAPPRVSRSPRRRLSSRSARSPPGANAASPPLRGLLRQVVWRWRRI